MLRTTHPSVCTSVQLHLIIKFYCSDAEDHYIIYTASCFVVILYLLLFDLKIENKYYMFYTLSLRDKACAHGRIKRGCRGSGSPSWKITSGYRFP